MLDITQTQLYISNFMRAMESHLTRRFIPMDRPHSRDTFVYILSGECTFTLDDGTVYESRAGDVLYMAKGQDYSMDVTSDQYDYIVCDFSFACKEKRRGLHFRPKNPPTVERLFRKLEKAHSVVAPDRRLQCLSILYQIYALLIQTTLERYVPGSARMRLENAKAFIHAHVASHGLSVARLAQDAQMSEVHFRKLFTDLYGISPSKFIIQERVAYAKELMALGELRLEDIALLSGFSSLPHFCKVFKATTGTTPAVYRSKHSAD